MKSVSVLAAAASLCAANVASAADLSSQGAGAVPAVVPFSWTGFYAGVDVGVNLTQRTVNPSLYVTDAASYYTPAIMADYTPGPFGEGRTGFLGGVHVGFNYQIQQWVVGAEADFMGSALASQANTLKYLASDPVTNLPSTIALSDRIQQNWLGTVRARIGYAHDRTLFYATAGLAYGSVKSSSAMVLTDILPTGTNPFDWAGQNSQTKMGYAIGAGVEYALSDQWIIRGEYLYYNLGTIASAMAGTTAVVGGVTYPNTEAFAGVTRTRIDGNIVRAALSYKF